MHHGGRHDDQAFGGNVELLALDKNFAPAALDQQKLMVVGVGMGANSPIMRPATLANLFDMDKVQFHVVYLVSI
jgi:hypothetical protein